MKVDEGGGLLGYAVTKQLLITFLYTYTYYYVHTVCRY